MPRTCQLNAFMDVFESKLGLPGGEVPAAVVPPPPPPTVVPPPTVAPTAAVVTTVALPTPTVVPPPAVVPPPPSSAPAAVVVPPPAVGTLVAVPSGDSSVQAEHLAIVPVPSPMPVVPLTVAPAPSSTPTDPNRLEGVVIDWRESYGFIQFNDGRRAYVHNSMCGGASLLAGQAVTGLCVPDTKNPGKWQAQQVERKISVAPDGRLEGKVQQWTGNFGFIQFCDGRRAFCHSSFLTGAAAGSVLSEGQSVVGNVQEDPKNPGKWQAQSVEVLPSLAPDNSGRVEGKVLQWNGTCGFVQFSDGRRAYVHATMCVGNTALSVGQTVFGTIVEDPSSPSKWQAQNVEGEPGRLDGIVTQWSDKGFGFIDFVDGRHAFVHSSACGGKHLSQGEAVSAVIVADQQNQGKWMAKGVVIKGPPGEDCTVTDWREKGSWGFVLLDSGTSAFIHANSFGGGGNLAIGMRLRVTTKFDTEKGRMMVEQVTGVAELSVQQLTEAANLAAAAQAARDAEAAVAAASGVPAITDEAAEAASGGTTLDPAALAAAAAEVAAAAPEIFSDPNALAAAAVKVAAAVPELTPGDLSHFVCSLGLTLPTASSSESELSIGVRTSGKVSEWNSAGFGFAMMEDGRRVYVHNSQCGCRHLAQGEAISAVVVPDPRNYGKWAAQSVERLGSSPPPVVAPGTVAATVEPSAKRLRLGL